jgi:hypothetical protein
VIEYIVDKVKGILPKEYIILNPPPGAPVSRLQIANEIRGLLLPSPITLEDEGFNEGIEAAINKVLGK